MTLPRVARAFGSVLACASFFAACSVEPDNPTTQSSGAQSASGAPQRGGDNKGGGAAPDIDAESETVARFKVTVDPSSPEPLLFEPVEAEAPGIGTKATSPTGPSVTNVPFNYVSLYGPGTWHAATQTLEATVVMTNNHPNRDFDEPRIVVTRLSDETGSVTFESSDNPGEKGVNATFAFADIQYAGSANRCGPFGVRRTATHRLVIRDTNPKTSFNFDLVVRAILRAPGHASIVPDCDGDGRSAELAPDGTIPDAGGDCNDQDPSQAGSDCDCNSCVTEGAACTENLSSGGFTCESDAICSCNIDGSGGSDVQGVVCNKDCVVTCDGAADGADTGSVACGTTCAGSQDGPLPNCFQSCSNTVSGTCQQDCTNGSSCTFACSGANAGRCFINTCAGGDEGPSSCSATCEGSGSHCGVNRCSEDSACDVTCGTQTTQSVFSSFCGIRTCETGAFCSVSCVNPGPGGCVLDCDDASGCQMDCSAIPAANRDALCKLNCLAGTRVHLGGGVYACEQD